MASQLNIKDAETIAMARQLAKARNTTVTGVIKAALEREIRERDAAREAKIAAIMKIVEDFRRTMPEDWRGKTSKEIMDEIYDEHGLPI